MLLRPHSNKFHALICVLVVAAVWTGASSSSTLSSVKFQAYSNAQVFCIKKTDKEIEDTIDQMRSKLTVGYCSRSFPPSFECADKIAFFHYCQFIEKKNKSSEAIGQGGESANFRSTCGSDCDLWIPGGKLVR
eukprot:5379552-Prymnesium_polylepis.1